MGALARAQAPLPMDALVTIGTPFLHVDRFESVEPGIRPPLRLGLVLAIVTVAAVLGRLFGSAGLAALWAVLSAHPVAVGIAGVYVGLGALGVAAARHMIRGVDLERQRADVVLAADDLVERLRRRCLLPRIEPLPTLLVKVPGDEAHGALAGAQILCWILHRAYAVPMRFVTDLRSAVRGDDDYDDRPLAALAFDLLLNLPLACIGLALRVILSVPVVLAVALLSAPFGPEFMRAAGAVSVAAGDTPPGAWRIVYMPPFDLRDHRREHLQRYLDAELDYLGDAFDELEREAQQHLADATRGAPHGRAYGDPRVADVIAHWLRVRVPGLFAAGAVPAAGPNEPAAANRSTA
jgi:hypothetical protein